MKIKPGVSAAVLHPSIEHALNVIDAWWIHTFGEQVTITSLGDSDHSDTSLHYGVKGDVRTRACDIRTRNLREGEPELARDEIARLLGEAFDVVLEGTHIHVEYDLDL